MEEKTLREVLADDYNRLAKLTTPENAYRQLLSDIVRTLDNLKVDYEILELKRRLNNLEQLGRTEAMTTSLHDAIQNHIL